MQLPLLTCSLPLCWAIILNFISRVIAFLFFFPLEAADADGHFLDITGCKNTNHDTLKKMPETRYTEEYWLFTLEIIWLTSSCQHPFLIKALKKVDVPEYII